MKISVKYFGASRDTVGVREEEFSLADPSSLDDLMTRVLLAHPGLEPARSALRVFVNGRWGLDDAALKDGDQVSLVPPVGGG